MSAYMYCSWYSIQLLKSACARALRVRTRLLQLFLAKPIVISMFCSIFRVVSPLLKGGWGVGSAQGLLDLLVLTDTGYGVSRGVGGCIAPDVGRQQLPLRCPVCGMLIVNCWCSRGD